MRSLVIWADKVQDKDGSKQWFASPLSSAFVDYSFNLAASTTSPSSQTAHSSLRRSDSACW